jgi:hypothetical protein
LRRQPTLRSQLNQIRLWVRQGRTDAWIAHKLDVSIEQLERFKRDHDLEGEETAPGRPADPLSVPPPDLDLYEELEVEEDEPAEALIEELEPEEEEQEQPAPTRARSRARSRDRGRSRARERDRDRDEERDDEDRDREPARDRDAERPPARDRTSADSEDAEEGAPARRRRRGRRGGRRRRRPSSVEATFDHGEEGYGLWLDPAVVDNPVYSQHWAGHRAVQVTFEADAITIRRAGADEPTDAAAGEANGEAAEEEDL